MSSGEQTFEETADDGKNDRSNNYRVNSAYMPENENNDEDDDDADGSESSSGSSSGKPDEPNSNNTSDESVPPDDLINRLKTNFDEEIEALGDNVAAILAKGSFFNNGFYQFISFLFISTAWTIATGCYSYNTVFIAYTPTHSCDIESMARQKSPDYNHWYLTNNTDDPACSAFDGWSNQTVKCTKWTYDRSQMKETLISEYDLVCDKNYHYETAYSIEQIGYVVGTFIFSYLADKIGRKPVLVFSLLTMGILGLVQVYLKNFYAFFVIGFFIDACACGVEASSITLVLEMFTTGRRTIFGIAIEIVWVIVLASLSPLAYFVNKWRELRLVIFIALSVSGVASFFLVQESIRWLININKLKKAQRVIQRIAKVNRLSKRVSFKQHEADKLYLSETFKKLDDYNKLCKISKNMSKNGYSLEERPDVNIKVNDRIVDLFKNPKTRLYVVIMCLNWSATSLVYDGLTYLNNFVGENIFINWVIMNAIELPAQILCFVIMSKLGRRFTVCSTLIIAGSALLLTCLDQIEVVHQMSWIRSILFVIAKFSVTQSYSAIIVYAPELFPTSLRSFGYGMCLFSGKLTSVLSPMISLYLSKVFPILPSIIYGVISIVCGFMSLLVPETLNRPLPNSIDDVLKWSKTPPPRKSNGKESQENILNF